MEDATAQSNQKLFLDLNTQSDIGAFSKSITSPYNDEPLQNSLAAKQIAKDLSRESQVSKQSADIVDDEDSKPI